MLRRLTRLREQGLVHRSGDPEWAATDFIGYEWQYAGPGAKRMLIDRLTEYSHRLSDHGCGRATIEDHLFKANDRAFNTMPTADVDQIIDAALSDRKEL